MISLIGRLASNASSEKARPTTPKGILIGDASGRLTSYEAVPRVLAIRRAMQRAGWGESVHLLMRTYHSTGLAAGTALEALAAGCDGVWTGVTDACSVVQNAQTESVNTARLPQESYTGAGSDSPHPVKLSSLSSGTGALGAASSLLTLLNLARLGNEHVTHMYDLPMLHKVSEWSNMHIPSICPSHTSPPPHSSCSLYLLFSFPHAIPPVHGPLCFLTLQAAVAATHAATGRAPPPLMEVVGARALDVCFDPYTSADHVAERVAGLLGVQVRRTAAVFVQDLYTCKCVHK